jgi:hypothetical protein
VLLQNLARYEIRELAGDLHVFVLRMKASTTYNGHRPTTNGQAKHQFDWYANLLFVLNPP